jgi:Recombination endonuclease VII
MKVGRPAQECKHKITPSSHCVTCEKEYQERYRLSLNSNDHKKYRLRHRFNLTPEQVIVMLKKQNNRCKLCQRLLIKFVIDHDHKCCPSRRSCGRCVRGLLCVSCNAMLGQLSRVIRIGIKRVKKYLGEKFARIV